LNDLNYLGPPLCLLPPSSLLSHISSSSSLLPLPSSLLLLALYTADSEIKSEEAFHVKFRFVEGHQQKSTKILKFLCQNQNIQRQHVKILNSKISKFLLI
jgi:hypothetical protein